MTVDLRPIETPYRGYRFRSRLEARWAVFFDEMQIPWEYEAQGFETEFGAYLPDFLLWGQLYAEVKPDGPIAEHDQERIRAFATKLNILLLVGAPSARRYAVLQPADVGLIDFPLSARKGWPWVESVDDALATPDDDDGSFLRACEVARAARFERQDRS